MKTIFYFLCSVAIFGIHWGTSTLRAEESTPPIDENLVVLVSDLHIGVNANKPAYAENNDKKFGRVVDKILAMNPRPSHVLVFGDVAYNEGTVADYQLSRPIFARLEAAGIPWTTAFGNHDRRAPFAEVFPEKVEKTEVVGRLVSIVKTPRVDFILLDSLNEGTVEAKEDTLQKEWLEKKLAEYEKSGKKVYVAAHHPSNEAGFQETIEKSPAVAGYIFGHHHRWYRPEIGSVPHFCVTSCAYKKQPLGFMTIQIGEDQDVFTLLTNDEENPNNGKTWKNARIAAKTAETVEGEKN